MLKAQYKTRGPVPQDVIEAVELQLPPMAAGQALVKMLAAPINPSDLLSLTGEYGILPPLPAIGGNEGVGEILEVDTNTTDLKPGQTVLLPAGCGTWRSHLIAEAKQLVALPKADPHQLAMLTVNPPTAYLLLRDFVMLRPGDWVIQNAANSGVGGYLIHLAKLRGLKTVNVVRRDSAMAPVREEGGDVVLVDGPDLHRRVREATDGAPLRLGVDAVGGAATDRLAACLIEGGMLVNYGRMSGEACQINAGSFVFHDVTLRGFWLARWFRQASQQQQIQLFSELIQLIASGKLKARIAATYDLSRVKEAVAAATAGEREGKILLIP